ncbi:F-box only protein 34 [Eublepharis macularius]|uniref:F-box only protein 34 n=1 Tax=Eublepharis macularius TaxID=481883 RepID=A0AA97J044_EUBMA|nr:F-box only protein 34 [Eublepharis macularius]XP_054828817.1 F-box only protein 34 [Eublepharis macularius]
MMKSSCRAGLHRELLNSTSSMFHQVKRISGMHLKPYLKLQKKERPLEINQDPPQSPPMSQQRLGKEENRSGPKASLLASPCLRRPLGNLSANSLCCRNGSCSRVEGPSVKEKRSALPATIHQGEDGEGLLDIWAVVKPGNTKEKVAFFAAQQCSSNRISSMKNKSTWDIDGRATKRRKKSLDLRKAKIHLERPREASGRCYQPEPFACGIEHCSVHNVSDGGEGGFPGRPLSVIEMVAFLEQRASALLADCTKNCPGAPAVTRVPGQPKVAPLAPGPFSTLGGCEPHSEKATGGSSSDGEQQAEPVRVSDMVAKLESECLRRQSEREAGSLSRNNSFRRNVGRVLLASGTPAANEAVKAPSGVLNQEERGGDDDGWRSKRGSAVADDSWEVPPVGQSCSFATALEENSNPKLKLASSAPSGGWCETKKIPTPLPSTYPETAQAHPCSLRGEDPAAGCMPKEPRAAPHLNSRLRTKESLSISISVTKTDKACRKAHPSNSSFGEDSLPGRLFLLLSEHETHRKHLRTGDATLEEHQGDARGKEDPSTDTPCMLNSILGDPPESPTESVLQALYSCHLKRQRSHDFLETRFKIQQLLEPQQYLVFLPHHILVKIFGLLPTRSLVALKCTCGYFKFIIEYYNIRPADSRWVRDPRYREDPCKQCKKKYVKGDVSLCRWHPKPYCQALPYGPGYWMCCHRSQKNVPGCKLGLHDNHWVPACHSFNRAIHKKPRETEEDC